MDLSVAQVFYGEAAKFREQRGRSRGGSMNSPGVLMNLLTWFQKTNYTYFFIFFYSYMNTLALNFSLSLTEISLNMDLSFSLNLIK